MRKNIPLMEIEIDNRTLFSLYREGMLDRKAYVSGLDVIKDRPAWGQSLKSSLIGLAISLLVSTGVFMISKNWGRLDIIHRLILLQGIMLFSFSISWILSLKGLISSLFLSSGLISAFIAFYSVQALYSSYFPEYIGLVVYFSLTLPLVFFNKNAVSFLVWATLNSLGALYVNRTEFYFDHRMVVLGLIPFFLILYLIMGKHAAPKRKPS